MEIFDETKQDDLNEMRQRHVIKINEIASIKEIIRAKMEKGETDVNELYGAINRLEADINALNVSLGDLKRGSLESEDADEQTAKAGLIAGGGGVNIRPRRNIPQVSSESNTKS